MDVESDSESGSERWEDFFGSSTDIGPSVLGYLDSLANNFNEEAKQLTEPSISKTSLPILAVNSAPSVTVRREAHAFVNAQPEDATHISNNNKTNQFELDCHNPGEISCNVASEQSATRRKTSDCRIDVESTRRSVRNFPGKFCVTPKVQRIVVNTNDRITTDTYSPKTSFLRSHPQSASFCNTASRKPKQAASGPTSATLGGPTNLPLSKNITKFSQLNDEQIEKRDPLQKMNIKCMESTDKIAPNSIPDDQNLSSQRNADQNSQQLKNIGQIVQSSDQLAKDLQNVSTLQNKIRLLTVGLEKSEAAGRDWIRNAGTPGSTSEEVNASHTTLPRSEGDECTDALHLAVILRKETDDGVISRDPNEDAFVKNCIDSSDYRNTIVQAHNRDRILSKSNLHDQRDDQQMFTDAKAKLFDTKNEPESTKLAFQSSAERSSFSDNATHSTWTSTPSIDTTNSGSVYSSKASLVPPSTPVLNTRPLSASSICSYTSSSSSSHSENHLSGRNCSAPPSYQASVESLADPSEPEEVNPQLLGGNVNRCGPDGDTIVIEITMCERAVREIIDSECSYVTDLGQVISGYLEDWKERACLKPGQLNVLFSNIQQIYEFNLKLLKRLRDAKSDPVQISDCFIDLHVEFSCYTKYCTSYPDAISLLTTLLQATHTNALLVSTQKMLKQTLPLGSYLLKPVQRILKYHLLLENLRKHCSEQQVVRAHELMKKVAQNIDQMKKKLDQQRLVKELAGILDGWLGPDLSVLGDLLREGHLLEHAKSRIVLLFQSMLIIAKPKEDKRLQFRAYIPCKNLMLVEHLPGEPASFNVIPFDDPKGVLKLTARNREEKRHWTQQIKQAMLQHYSDIPKRAMELVLQLGNEDERFIDKPYWKRATNNSPVPEYLERRQQSRRSEMRMRSKKNLQKKDTVMPTFRSYSSDLEMMEPEATSEECKCDSVKKQLLKEMKTRSDAMESSETGIIFSNRSVTKNDEQERLKKSLYERRKISIPLKMETKMKTENLEGVKTYNSTMIPKRISDIRKRRPKTLTGSSTFYTELNTQNNEAPADHEPDSVNRTRQIASMSSKEVGSISIKTPKDSSIVDEKQLPMVSDNNTSSTPLRVEQLKDSDIISKLLLDVEQFNKILNKPLTKKKSFDSYTCSRPAIVASAKKPDPPRTDPPCEDDQEVGKHLYDGDQQNVVSDTNGTEPIYESLLRNVHVPYKYAPPPLTRHSLPGGEKSKNICLELDINEFHCNQSPRKNRPESDYVTLAFSKLGLLKGIAGDKETSVNDCHQNLQLKPPGDTKTSQLLRNSDTNISYHNENNALEQVQGNDDSDETSVLHPSSSIVSRISEENKVACRFASSKQGSLERQGSLNMNPMGTQKGFLQRFISLHTTVMSSRLGSDSNLLHRDILPPQRKLSDPNGGYLSSGKPAGPIYKLGSIDLGSRIAYLDYADPKTLFIKPSLVAPTSSLFSTMSESAGTNLCKHKLGNHGLIDSHCIPEPCENRDSVLASSSSSDSVCDKAQQSVGRGYAENDENCFYERTVEECLEHDFRDSAVYSGDDNDRRIDRCMTDCTFDQHNVYETLSSSIAAGQTHPLPVSTQRNSGEPPPIPTKPAHLGRTKHHVNTADNSTLIKQGSSRGWVLQQVKRFQ